VISCLYPCVAKILKIVFVTIFILLERNEILKFIGRLMHIIKMTVLLRNVNKNADYVL